VFLAGISSLKIERKEFSGRREKKRKEKKRKEKNLFLFFNLTLKHVQHSMLLPVHEKTFN
jgi:hypothetical protein